MQGQEGGVVDTDDEDSHGKQWITLALSSSVATCSVPCAAHGWIAHGRAGGGDNPPYHTPTFVLTHYEHEPLVMEGGTTFFYFVTGGIEEALKLAKQAAGDKDVKIGGGVSTVRQYLRAGLIDSSGNSRFPQSYSVEEKCCSPMSTCLHLDFQ